MVRSHSSLILVCATLALLFSGCVATPAPVRVAVAPSGPATIAEIAAKDAWITSLETKLTQLEDLSQRAAGAVYGVQNANVSTPEGLAKQAVSAQAQEAASALPTPTAEQKLAKEHQNAAILAGQLVQVKAEMGQAISENEALKGKLADTDKARAEAEARAKQAETAAAIERREATVKLQAQFDSMAAQIKQARDDARNQAMLGQVAALNKAGAWLTGAGLAALGLCAIFGGLAGLRVVGPVAALAVGMGMACFGLAQIVGQWWFKWAVLVAVVALFAGAAWWVLSKYRMGILKESAEAKTAKLKTALGAIVPVLDDAYDSAESSVKDTLDKLIFNRLSNGPSKMPDQGKAAIHEIRAESIGTSSV